MLRTLTVLLVLIGHTSYAQLTTDHLMVIEGEWSGTLTYLNYSDDKTMVTLPMEMKATNAGKAIDLAMSFTEPGGGVEKRTDRIKLKKNRMFFSGDWDLGKATVQSLTTWEVEMSQEGMDNRLKADIVQVMKITDSDILITKKVRYRSEPEYFIRNEYKLKRKGD